MIKIINEVDFSGFDNNRFGMVWQEDIDNWDNFLQKAVNYAKSFVEEGQTFDANIDTHNHSLNIIGPEYRFRLALNKDMSVEVTLEPDWDTPEEYEFSSMDEFFNTDVKGNVNEIFPGIFDK